MAKILIIGPSSTGSRGGMATVIGELLKSKELTQAYDISAYASYIDGSFIIRRLFCLVQYIRFLFIAHRYDLFYIHMAAKGSVVRKGLYLKVIKKLKKKVIIHIHGAEFMDFYRASSASFQAKMIGILQSADMVIALSEGLRKEFEQAFGLNNCVSLVNGVNADAYVSARIDPKCAAASFAMFGRLGTRKGTYDLVEAVAVAAREVPEIKCYLVGDGEIDKVNALIKERAVEKNIETTGWLVPSESIDVLKRVATVVLPSYNEGLPMAILEGMAAGKAIISTSIAAIPEVVEKENGILIQPGDIDALAKALVFCCRNPETLASMFQANIRKAEGEYSIKTMHQKVKAYFFQVLGA